jgi:predicted Zn finger-like uncharacterized protein
MANTIHCPSCNRELRVPDELLGKKVKCPACSTTFTASVAGPQEAPPAPMPEPGQEEVPAHPRPTRRPAADEYEEEPPEEDFDRPRRFSRAQERAKGRIMAPAICLLVAAILGVLAGLLQIGISFTPQPPLPPPQPGEPEWIREFQKSSRGPTALIGGVIGVVYCGIIIFASIQMLNMRMWGFSLAGSIMSMINCFNCCCILGLPFGIWATIVLSDQEVKNAFR